MPYTFARAGLVCLLLGAAACSPPPNFAPVPASPPVVQLVDSVAWEDEAEEGFLRRVEVRDGVRVDTIPGVLTEDLPVLVGGSRVLGFAYERDIATAFEYDLRARTVRRDSLPGDLSLFFSAPTFSPDGLHLAYVVVPGNDSAYAVVRTWPGRELVWRSATVQVPATDAAGGTQVRWLSPDEAEVVIETGPSTDEAWYHVVGSVQRRAVVSADTVRERPRW
jgi:hypothetical protein